MNRSILRLLAISLFCLFSFLSSASSVFAQQLKIVHIDVGQGDSTLIIGPTGTTLLFDSGPNGVGTKLRQVFDSNHLTSLNYFVAGHYHADHIGSIDELLATGITLTTASYDRGSSYTSQSYTDYVNAVGTKRKTITLGQIIDLGGGATAECVAVNGQTPNGTVSTMDSLGADDENAHSISLIIRYGTFDYLISSDLTGGGVSPFDNSTKPDVESKVAPYVGDVDVVHINHHGSSTSTNQFWVNTLHAEQAVISEGNGNTYGHPAQDVLDRLTNSTSIKNIWQTETGAGGTSPKVIVGGDITFVTNGSSYTITDTAGHNLTYSTDGVTKGSPPSTSDFSISITPSSQTVSSTGGTTSYTININRTGGFSSSVSFSLSGLPAGASGSFNPNPTTGNSSTLTVTASSGTIAGSYPFTVTATGGSPTLTRTASATIVKQDVAPDFSISITPSSQTVQSMGGTASYTVNMIRVGGFSSSVSLSVSGLPTGTSGSFSPNPTTGNSSTLTINVTSATTAGSYSFTVSATGGSPTLTRTATATISKTLNVVINEIAWSGSPSSPYDEWLELYNPTAQAVSLTGWKIVSDNGVRVYNLSGSIPAGGYYLIERSQAATSVTADLVVTNLILANTGDKLDLQDSTGKSIEVVNTSGGAWYAGDNTTAHHTMERISAAVSGDLASNWKSNNGIKRNGTDSSGKPINGTPRAKNSATP